MPFCGNCGAKIEDGKKFCSACGAPTDEELEIVENVSESAGNQENTYQEPKSEPVFETAETENFNDDDDSDIDDFKHNKVALAFANIPFLFWIPLVACQNSVFCKKNANRGLVITIAFAAMNIVRWLALMLGSLIAGIIPILPTLLSIGAWIVGMIGWLVFILGFIYFILTISSDNSKVKFVPQIDEVFDKIIILK